MRTREHWILNHSLVRKERVLLLQWNNRLRMKCYITERQRRRNATWALPEQSVRSISLANWFKSTLSSFKRTTASLTQETRPPPSPTPPLSSHASTNLTAPDDSWAPRIRNALNILWEIEKNRRLFFLSLLDTENTCVWGLKIHLELCIF